MSGISIVMGAPPLQAEIANTRKIGGQVFYVVEFLFPHGEATALTFGFDGSGKITASRRETEARRRNQFAKTANRFTKLEMFQALFQTLRRHRRSPLGAPRLRDLRAALKGQNLDRLLVPRADAHQNEYVAPCEERLAWLTGFTGSAGFAIVLTDKAALFVDGRLHGYRRANRSIPPPLQASILVDSPRRRTGWAPRRARAPASATIPGCIPRRNSRDSRRRSKRPGELVAVEENPIDILWADRPPRRTAR